MGRSAKEAEVGATKKASRATHTMFLICGISLLLLLGVSDALVGVILCHHDVAAAVINPALVAIVSLSDRLGRASDLGLGYAEQPDPIDLWGGDWRILADKCPLAAEITWSEFAKESAN